MAVEKKKEGLYVVGKNGNLYCHYDKKLRGFSEKLKAKLSQDPAIYHFQVDIQRKIKSLF